MLDNIFIFILHLPFTLLFTPLFTSLFIPLFTLLFTKQISCNFLIRKYLGIQCYRSLLIRKQSKHKYLSLETFNNNTNYNKKIVTC